MISTKRKVARRYGFESHSWFQFRRTSFHREEGSTLRTEQTSADRVAFYLSVITLRWVKCPFSFYTASFTYSLSYRRSYKKEVTSPSTRYHSLGRNCKGVIQGLSFRHELCPHLKSCLLSPETSHRGRVSPFFSETPEWLCCNQSILRSLLGRLLEPIDGF